MTATPEPTNAMEALESFKDEIRAARNAAHDAVMVLGTTSNSTTRRTAAKAFSHLADVYERTGQAVCVFHDGDLLSTVLIDAEHSAKQDARDWNDLADSAAKREAAQAAEQKKDTKP